MAITSHSTESDNHTQSDGRRYVRHSFTDHLGVAHPYPSNKVEGGWSEPEYLSERLRLVTLIEDDLAQKEVSEAVLLAETGGNPDKVPEHQPQESFDRRVLGRMMTNSDAHQFYAAYPMFQAVEGRGGANANQRAVYLGISTAEYNAIAERFNNVSGVAWFLDDEKSQVWDGLPEAFI
jgi:hypothetical protein